MERPNSSSGIMRTKSDQLVETAEAVAAAMRSPTSGEATGGAESGGTLSRKSSRRSMLSASPGRAGGNSKNTHIRKSRSAQIKLDLDEVSSGAALSRASSASLGFSFSFTGFTVPPDEVSDFKPFSDDDTREFFFSSAFRTVIQEVEKQMCGPRATSMISFGVKDLDATWLIRMH